MTAAPSGEQWRSPDGERNARVLRLQYAAGFDAIAEFDRMGHLLLQRAMGTGPAGDESAAEKLSGVAFLRRAVTLFTGIRSLLEHSLPDVAKAPARAYFELWLQHQCMAYGSQNSLSLESHTSAKEREPRAARYFVAAERRGLLRRGIALYDDSTYGFASAEDRDALEKELFDEMARIRKSFTVEWEYFGDVTPGSVKRIADDKPWYAGEFSPPPVTSFAALAKRLGYSTDYQILYGPFSALMHSSGLGHDLTIEDGIATVHHPHDPTWFETIAYFVMGWHRMMLMTSAKWHCPGMIPELQTVARRCEAGMEGLKPKAFPNVLE